MKINDSDIELVREAGGEFTDEYQRILERRAEFDPAHADALARYTEAVLGDEDSETVSTWRALALAESVATTAHQATVRNALDAAAHPRLVVEIGRTAASNYERIRSAFNDHAAAFTQAHAVIPANTDPALLALAPEKTRKAWVEGQTRAGMLNELIPTLLAAARLAGVTADNTHALGFTINADGLHRRQVWEAWSTDDRWTQLLDLGAAIHAPALDDYTYYREPKPLEKVQVRGEWGVRIEEVDPEDPDYDE